jgi:hypothetical protein
MSNCFPSLTLNFTVLLSTARRLRQTQVLVAQLGKNTPKNPISLKVRCFVFIFFVSLWLIII